METPAPETLTRDERRGRRNLERERRRTELSVPAQTFHTVGGPLQIHSAQVRSRTKRLVVEPNEQRWLPLAAPLGRRL